MKAATFIFPFFAEMSSPSNGFRVIDQSIVSCTPHRAFQRSWGRLEPAGQKKKHKMACGIYIIILDHKKQGREEMAVAFQI